MNRQQAADKIGEFEDGLVTSTLIEVRGYTDTSDRAETLGKFRSENIYAMMMTRLY